jgi:hypothetical protein
VDQAGGARIETLRTCCPVRHYADRKQEHFLCASISRANEILNIRVVSIGLIDRTPFTREKYSRRRCLTAHRRSSSR